MGFYDNYMKLCRERGISSSAAAVEIGFNKSVVSRWKTGGSPSNESLVMIAKYFGVPVAELVGEEKKPAPEGELSEERREVLSMIDGMSDKELIRLKQLIKIAKEGL